MLAVEEEQQFQLGPFTVRMVLRRDNPRFPAFAVFKGGDFVGKSFSRPSLDDCTWLDRQNRGGTLYASVTTYVRLRKPGNSELGKPRKR